MQLNEKQEEAKNHIKGPMLIIAGAGSGKTATLTARVEYMIKEKDLEASSLLCVTFTNKAAKEMRARMGKALGVQETRNIYNSYNLPLIGTFHSLGVFFLKRATTNLGEHIGIMQEEICSSIGLKKDFVIYDESDKLSVLKHIIKDDLHLEEKQFPARQIAFFISNAKNSLITPKGYEAHVDSPIKEVVFNAYGKYEERLRQNNAIDFDDILIKTLLLLKIPQVLNHYQEKYKYLMVDEYQDTNSPQYEIVRLLASKYRNLAVVGDDWQSIYSWRGADMRNILNFKKDYPDALIVKLEQNYRSTKNIIKAANTVIGNNKSSLKKELWTENIDGELISYIEAPDDKTEASTIANIIKDKVDEGGKLGDNLILYRTNGQSRQLEEALMMKAMAYRVVGGQKFYDRKEVKDILSYLKAIHNNDDIVSTKRIINVPSRKIGGKTIEILDNYREQFGLNYFNIIENVDEVEDLKPQARKSLFEVGEIFSELINLSNKLAVSHLIKRIVELIGYSEYLKEQFTVDEYEAKMDNLHELENVASEYDGMEPRESLSQFLEDVALITDMDIKDDREDYVTLMTIHTSKGLEQKRVFIAGVEDGIFPHVRSINDSVQMEEERRLLYVAMTRAKEELFITRAKERFHFGDYVRNPESRFIKEIPSIHIEDYKIPIDSRLFTSQTGGTIISDNISIKSRIKPLANNDISVFARGDKIVHHKFGSGLITSLNGEIAEIAFPGKGIKKMNIKIAPVSKV